MKLGKYAEVFDFIHQYQNKLNQTYRDSTFYFCLTRYHYAIGDLKDYDPVKKEKLIEKIKTTNPLTERTWLLEKLSVIG